LGDNFIIETAIKRNVRYLVSRDDDVKLDKGVSNFLSHRAYLLLPLKMF